MVPDMMRSIVREKVISVREEVTIVWEAVTSLREEVPILREALTSLREEVRSELQSFYERISTLIERSSTPPPPPPALPTAIDTPAPAADPPTDMVYLF